MAWRKVVLTDDTPVGCPKCGENAYWDHRLACEEKDYRCRHCGFIGHSKEFKLPEAEWDGCSICGDGGCVSCRPEWFIK